MTDTCASAVSRAGQGPAPDHTRASTPRRSAGTVPSHDRTPDISAPSPRSDRSPHPSRRENSYPNAYEHLAQLFDHPSAPDLVVLHSAAHFWGDQGGHLGEHGSLGIVQARAPFIAAGAGIRSLGQIEANCRLIDVAPTMLELLGCPAPPGAPPDSRLIRQDGVVLDDLLTGPGQAGHVVAMLLDGTNPNVLYEMAATGDAPHISRLMDAGTTYRYGAIASLPTVTLANHTGILTGTHPGHHGILHNAWIDRLTGEQVVTNSPSTWPTAMRWLSTSVETVHDAVHRSKPGAAVDLDQRAVRHRCRLLDLRPHSPWRTDRPTSPGRITSRRDGTVRPAEQGLPLVVSHRPHRGRAVLRDLERSVPRALVALPDVQLGQLHADRRSVPRRRALLRDRRGIGP